LLGNEATHAQMCFLEDLSSLKALTHSAVEELNPKYESYLSALTASPSEVLLAIDTALLEYSEISNYFAKILSQAPESYENYIKYPLLQNL